MVRVMINLTLKMYLTLLMCDIEMYLFKTEYNDVILSFKLKFKKKMCTLKHR